MNALRRRWIASLPVAVVAGFTLCGIAASIIIGYNLAQQARAEWKSHAFEEARRLTRSVNLTLEHVGENIRNVTALFASSNRVTQQEFERFTNAAQGWNYEIRLRELAFAACEGDNGGTCEIQLTTDPKGLFAPGDRPSHASEFNRAMLQALSDERGVSFSDPFRLDDGMAMLALGRARNEDRPGLVMGLIDLQQMFETFDARIPVGLHLRVLHRTGNGDPETVTQIYSPPPPSQPVAAAFQLEPRYDEINWTLVWELAENYEGGPATAMGIWVAVAGSALAGLAGTVMAILLTQNAIVRQRVRERTQDLQRARVEAEMANRAKSVFLANMSHELRTPLNAIIGFSEVVKDGLLGPVGDQKYRSYAKDIHDSGQHLLALVNDVLDISRVDADQVNLNLEPVPLTELVESSLRQVQQQAQAKEILLHSASDADLPVVSVDAVRVRQALINVLGNAVKFTPSGGQVAIAATRDIEAGGVAVTVSDTGPGIAEKDIQKALEPFGQIETSMTRRYEGAGLGLPLAKRLIEAHGGGFELTSGRGRGTQVTMRLPATCVIAEPTAGARQAS